MSKVAARAMRSLHFHGLGFALLTAGSLLLAAAMGFGAEPPADATDDKPAAIPQPTEEVRDRVRTVIATAVSEHAAGGVIINKEVLFGQGVVDPQWLKTFYERRQPAGFRNWRLGRLPCPRDGNWTRHLSVHYSATLEAFIAAQNDLPGRVKTGALPRDQVVLAASEYLTDVNPERRAVACEILAHFPLEALKLDRLPGMVALAQDDAEAFSNAQSLLDLPAAEDRDFQPGSLTVGQVARATIETMVGLQFADGQGIQKWWGTCGTDKEDRLWYVRMCQSYDPQASIVRPGRKPELTLQLWLLANNDLALRNETGGVEKSNFRRGQQDEAAVLKLVREQNLKPMLIAILRREFNWQIIPGGQLGLSDGRALELLESTIEPADAPQILKLLEAREGVASLASAAEPRLRLIGRAIQMAPDCTEEILASQIKQDSECTIYCRKLIEVSGLKHWDVIKASCLRKPEYASGIIDKISKLDPTESRRALGELLSELPFVSAKSHDEEKYLEQTQSWLRALARAAESFNNGVAVVDGRDLAPAVYTVHQGKGSRRIPANIAHDAHVYRVAFEGRERARKRLMAFFTQKSP